MQKLPKHGLEEPTTAIRKEYVKRFERRRSAKYGTPSKAFSDAQIKAFFRAVDNEKFRLLFSYQAQLGLRIGEVVRVNLKDINLETRELTIKTEKAHTLDTLLIPMDLFKQTIAYITSHKADIEGSQGYLFFRQPEHSSRVEPFLEQNYAHKRFRHYVRLAELDGVYEISEESVAGRIWLARNAT